MYVSTGSICIQNDAECSIRYLSCSLVSDRHTSGSTGMPKPLIWTQESMARQQGCSSQKHSELNGTSIESMLWGKRVMVTVPPFHVRTGYETPHRAGIV